MRSNFAKEVPAIHKSKSKKVIDYVHLLSTHEDEKAKKINKKTHPNKNQTESKTNLNKQFCSNKLHIDQEKFSLNLNHQIKKHTRSKTQYFKPFTHTVCPDDMYEEEPIPSKYDAKKKTIKKQQSQKRIKSQSSKRLHPNSQSKSNIHQSKTKLKPQTSKYASNSLKSSKIHQQKALSKQDTKHQDHQKKYISNLNQNLNVLKNKLKKQKSTYSSKDKKVNKKLEESSKNMTFLNLSQILQRNDCDQDLFPIQNDNRTQIKSERSGKNHQKQQKIKEILTNLEQRVGYITESIIQAAEQKKGIQKKNHGAIQKMKERSFSFMENQVINAKLRKSNFSTGVGSIGPDYEIQELLKLKNTTQSEINKQISMDLKSIREIYQAADHESKPKTSRVIESDLNSKERSSARTYKNQEEDFRGNVLNEKMRLLSMITQYHEMTTQILPVFSELNQGNENFKENPQVVEEGRRESMELREENMKITSKYNDILQKNTKYQQLMNYMIQEGIDVERHMQRLFSKKS